LNDKPVAEFFKERDAFETAWALFKLLSNANALCADLEGRKRLTGQPGKGANKIQPTVLYCCGTEGVQRKKIEKP
jgi:hypothetical protein